MAKEGLKYLVEKLCEDENLDNNDKVGLLYEWKARIIDSNSSRIMSKDMAKAHFDGLEIIDDAIRLVSP